MDNIEFKLKLSPQEDQNNVSFPCIATHPEHEMKYVISLCDIGWVYNHLNLVQFIGEPVDVQEGEWVMGGSGYESEGEVWQHDGEGYISEYDFRIIASTDKIVGIPLLKEKTVVDYVLMNGDVEDVDVEMKLNRYMIVEGPDSDMYSGVQIDEHGTVNVYFKNSSNEKNTNGLCCNGCSFFINKECTEFLSTQHNINKSHVQESLEKTKSTVDVNDVFVCLNYNKKNNVSNLILESLFDELFLNEKISRLVKEKGFDEECMGYWECNELAPPAKLIINYTNVPSENPMAEKRPGLFKVSNKNSTLPQWAISAPTYDQIRRWFKKNHEIDIWIEHGTNNTNDITISGLGCLRGSHKDYNLAMDIAIQKALKTIKND